MLEEGAVSANLACGPGDCEAEISPYQITETRRLDTEEMIEVALGEGKIEEVKMYEKVMWWNKGIDEASMGFTDNFVSVVGDQWAKEEKE